MPVQQVLEDAIARFPEENVTLHVAGRTDERFYRMPMAVKTLPWKYEFFTRLSLGENALRKGIIMSFVIAKRRYMAAPVFQLLVVAGLCSLAGLLSRFSWFFDLFNHFRPQIFVACLPLLLLGLTLKDRKSVVVGILVVVLNLGFIAERLYAFPGAVPSHRVSFIEEPTEHIKVFFANVLTSNRDHQSLLDRVDENRPDILVFTEIDDGWLKSLEPLKAAYPYSFALPRSDNFGLAVYAKKSFTQKIYDVGEYGLPLAVMDMGNYALVAVHPIPPLSQENTQELRRYIAKIAEIIRTISKPLIVTGDLNTTLWSDNFNLLRGLGLQRSNGLGIAWTWPSGFFPLALQIDHIFVRDAATADFQALADIGSDHFPVQASVVMKTRLPESALDKGKE